MTMKLVVAFLTLTIITFEITLAIDVPEYLHVCKRSDPQLAECIKESVNSLRPYLKDGIPEMHVPSLEPLYIGDLNILDGSAGITVKAKKLNIYGASNFEIKKLKSSADARRFDFEINLPRLQGQGNYDINGQILSLPIKGSGPFTGNFTNFYAFVKVVFEITNVDGVDNISVKEFSVKVRTGKGRIRLENLFNGDKAIGDVINDTINQNFELFTNEVIGPIERALEKKFIAIANKILENFTYDQLFPA